MTLRGPFDALWRDPGAWLGIAELPAIPDLVHARDVLAAFPAPDLDQARVRDAILAWIAAHPADAHERSCAAGHLTASALVLDALGERVLLTHHRKLDRWLQLGGHCDGDANLAGVALREALEESGIAGLRIHPVPLDVDIHRIPARAVPGRPQEPEHDHLDTRFVVRAPTGAVASISDESHDLGWFGPHELAALDVDPSLLRLFDRVFDTEPHSLPHLADENVPHTLHPLRRAGVCGSVSVFRAAFEELLATLPREGWDRLTHLMRPARGAWVGVVRSPTAGRDRALFLGNALSGSTAALVGAGWHVTLLDPSSERLELAGAALAAQAGTRYLLLRGGDGPRLPFRRETFELVVLEEGPGTPPAATLDEARRVTAGELFVCGDNRLGYKRSSGRYWDFHVPGPLEFLRAALAPRGGARTLRGWRRLLDHPDFAPAQAFALYPDRRDFAYVAALDAPHPALFLGPSERRNRLKVAARAVGLVPLLAPSYALRSERRSAAPAQTAADVVLAELARRLSLPAIPELEHLVATRGNVGVWLTRGARGEAECALCLHVALGSSQRDNLERHFGFLERLARTHPRLPLPGAHCAGSVAGLWLTCEDRLPGFAAHHGLDPLRLGDLVRCVAGDLASLVEPAPAGPAKLGDEDYEALIGARFERVRRGVGDAMRRSLARLESEVRELLSGRPVPRAIQHGDLRPKHVQLDVDRRVVGYLDWATSREHDLPLLDLAHLWLHAEKQVRRAAGERVTETDLWRALVQGRVSSATLTTFAGYADATGLDADLQRGLLLAYPAWIGWVAETYWSYSPPHWFERHFDL